MGGRIAKLFLRQMTSGAGSTSARHGNCASYGLRVRHVGGARTARLPHARQSWETDKGAGISEATAQRVDERSAST
jgi:hypothetical protein